ncbi:MAG: amidohydrolase, partial [Novosphingobium sp.]|nr:amidohydrolase [Novosphingobium sp.]
MSSVLVCNVRIFDGETLLDGERWVRIEGAQIAVMGVGKPIASDADVVIDGAGRVLMPGMVESHAHLTWGSSVEKIYHQFILPADE